MKTTVINGKVHPSWDEIDEKYQWFAIEDSGNGYVYENKPKIITYHDLWDAFGVYMFVCHNKITYNWKDSLVSRKEYEDYINKEPKQLELDLSTPNTDIQEVIDRVSSMIKSCNKDIMDYESKVDDLVELCKHIETEKNTLIHVKEILEEYL